MVNIKYTTENELSTISGGGLGSDILVGAFSGAYEAGKGCILAGPQTYALCALAGAVAGGLLAFGMRH